MSQPNDSAPSDRPLLVSVERAAEMLSVHRTTVYDLLRSQQLPSIKWGRRRLISVDALHEFVSACAASGNVGDVSGTCFPSREEGAT